MVVFGQGAVTRQSVVRVVVVVLGKNACFRAKWLYSGKVVFLVQKWLYSR